MHLDGFVPTWDFNERHQRDLVASAAAVMGAVEDVTWREVPLFRVLMSIRSLKGAEVGHDVPVLEGMAASGFSVLHRGEDELVFGIVVPSSLRPSASASTGSFAALPGHLAIAGNFRYDGAVLTTETRVRAGDDRSRRRFRFYWAVVRPFSGLIRREWLRAIASRATAGSPTPRVRRCRRSRRGVVAAAVGPRAGRRGRGRGDRRGDRRADAAQRACSRHVR